jgi:hypothetical protein
LVVGVLASLAAVGLHAGAIAFPALQADDFAELLHSWTWSAAWEHLWAPHNEHTMPLGRLSTAALVQLGGGRLAAMPGLTALQGPLAVLLGMWLVYLLVRRETGHAFYGVLAMAFFGVSTQYNDAVTWFAASFAVLALDTTLLALLAAQSWRQTGRLSYLAYCAICAALAPGWFASGILAGPLCCLSLLPGREPARQPGRVSLRVLAPRLLAALIPLTGSLLFLVALLVRPDTAERIVHSGHYGGKTVLEVFDPVIAVRYTGRTLVNHVVFGTLGFWQVTCPVALIPVALVVLTLAAAWWWWWAPHRRLLLLGSGFVLFNYLLIYSFRAPWSYAQVNTWNRYDLFPHVGLTLFLAGGLPAVPGTGRLSWRQARAVCLLAALSFACQLPRGLRFPYSSAHEAQMPELHRVDEMDARCRQLRIAGPTAREALGWLDLPDGDPNVNGWDFLRGSDDPLPLTGYEVRRLLAPPDP